MIYNSSMISIRIVSSEILSDISIDFTFELYFDFMHYSSNMVFSFLHYLLFVKIIPYIVQKKIYTFSINTFNSYKGSILPLI